MFHARMIVSWPDGDRVTAELKSESAEADCPVTYTGAIGRLVGFPSQSNHAFVRFKLRKLAHETGATYTEEVKGEYDRQAGGRAGL